MARKIYIATATFVALLLTTTAMAQVCGGPVPVVSIYTTFDKQTTFGLGGEVGILRDDSPWGYAGGVLFSIKTPQALQLEKAGAQTKESIYPYDLSIYMKGSFRLFRSERTSFHAVSLAEINTRSELDVKSGIRLLLPISDRVALSAEPLYSAKKQSVTGRVGISIAL